jgi:uncharacterized protein with WD repeat
LQLLQSAFFGGKKSNNVFSAFRLLRERLNSKWRASLDGGRSVRHSVAEKVHSVRDEASARRHGGGVGPLVLKQDPNAARQHVRIALDALGELGAQHGAGDTLHVGRQLDLHQLFRNRPPRKLEKEEEEREQQERRHKQRTKNKEQRTKNKEQRTKNKEQRTKNKEQRTKNDRERPH